MPEATRLRIYVDADGCPVRQEVCRVARRHGVGVVLVSNSRMRAPREDWIEQVIVDGQFDAADDWIVQRVTADDIVVSGDIPLAARCRKKGARVIDHRGGEFTEDNIGDAMATRALLADLRGAGEITKGPRAFTPRDRSRFLQSLEDAVQCALRAKRREGPS